MAAEFTPVANNITVAIKKNTNDWGGAPMVLGALDGMEASGWNIDITQALIGNQGYTGSLDPAPSSPGPRTPTGTIPFDLYFQDASWRFLAAGFGSESVATVVTGIFDHDFISVSTHAGMNLTVAALFPSLYVRQLDFAKVTGFKLAFDEATSRGNAEATLACFDERTNQGTVNDASVVASVALVNGALTILASPAQPQQLSITITGGPPTEAIITIWYVNEYGKAVTKVHTFSTDGLTGTTNDTVKTVIGASVSGLVGTGSVKIGVTAGRGNTLTSMASVTKHAVRSPVLFKGLQCYLGLQSQAGALDATNLINIESVEITRNMNPNTRVTSEFGYLQSEPATGGAGQASTQVSIKFGALTDINQIQMWRRRSADPCRMKLVITGNFIGVLGHLETLTIWLQGLQASEADPKPSGQGVIPFDMTFMGSIQSAVPSDWPAGILAPIHMRLRNAQSGLLLT
jgi:hypothetical protein